MRRLFLVIGLISLLSINCWAYEDFFGRPTLEETKKQDWFLNSLYDGKYSLCYMMIDENGWFTDEIRNIKELKELINQSEKEIVIPIFPTVYVPSRLDKQYYDTILKSDIKPRDKVLVIGAGSGSDAWVAWFKSQTLIYTIEINPMAIANTYATAALAGFRVKQILGDIRDVSLPKDFSNFDFVLWNMPFVREQDIIKKCYHDGDDGSILKSFLSLLPSLLKKNGQAIIMNTKHAEKFINFPNSIIEGEGDGMVYINSNSK